VPPSGLPAVRSATTSISADAGPRRAAPARLAISNRPADLVRAVLRFRDNATRKPAPAKKKGQMGCSRNC
jgi:hypothetical protein